MRLNDITLTEKFSWAQNKKQLKEKEKKEEFRGHKANHA